MLDVRDLQFVSALARRKHFARAAQDCGVSQPAFSMRIRRLEERLGIAIVRRGNQFEGLTAEGETLLRHARKILDDMRALEEDVCGSDGAVSGNLTLGVIPTASAYTAHLVARINTAHPAIRVSIKTATSLAIQQGLEDGIYDAGVTYHDGVAADMLVRQPLCLERYVLLAPETMLGAEMTEISWAEAALLPLTLLERGMQNRRILDQAFDEAGQTPNVVTESNGFVAAIVMALNGHSATILPEGLTDVMGALAGCRTLPLVEPVLNKRICCVTLQRNLGLPTVSALRKIVAAQNEAAG